MSFLNPQPYIINEKDLVQITCVTDPSVYQGATLVRNGLPLTSKVHHEGTKKFVVFTLGPARLENSGTYSCQATIRRTGQLKVINLDVQVKGIRI